MRIETFTPAYADQYEAFVLSKPETLLYQSMAYQSLLVHLLDCKQQTLLALNGNDEIEGVLPLMSKEGQYGCVLNSLPFYGSNGSFICDSSEALNALVNAYDEAVNHETTAAATIIENPLSPQGEQVIHALIDERIGQLTLLPSSDDPETDLMASFHSKTRNMVRKAGKLGVKVSVENIAIPFLVEVHEENMLEIGGTAKSQQFFSAIPEYFKEDTDYRVYIAHLDDEPIAALLVFYYNKTVEYYTPVVRKEHRDTQALSAIIYQAMCDAARSGYSWWNWGGTWLTQDGVYRFKSRWGTQDMPYRYFTSVGNPELLKAAKEELLAGYPNFFTVPFSALST